MKMRELIEQMHLSPRGSMKGLPMLRVLIFGTLIVLMFSFSIILFSGGYIYDSGATQNGTLASQYGAVVGNQLNPSGGIFIGSHQLANNINTQGGSASTANSGTASLTSGSQIAASFFTTLPGIVSNILILIGSPFGIFNINPAYYELIGSVMVVSVIVLAILAIISLVYS
jgi:hypothetical protein